LLRLTVVTWDLSAIVTRKTDLMGIIFIATYCKEFEDLPDKHGSPFYSRFAVHRWQIERVGSAKNLNI
jgi:hypothetical protein